MCVLNRLRMDHSTFFPSALVMTIGLGLSGCGGMAPDETTPAAAAPAPVVAGDPDDVPIKEADVLLPTTYGEAITRIEGYRDTIRDEIAAGRPTKAHRGLDELDIVLKRLPTIARDSGVPKDRWELVNTKAQDIRGLFDQVHSRIDANQEPDYGSVSETIDRAIAALAEVMASPAEKAEPKP